MSKIDEIKSSFGDLAKPGPLQVEIEDKTLELDMRVKDVNAIMAIGQKQELGEKDAEKLSDTIKRVLYRSYLPYWDDATDSEPNELSDPKVAENEEAKEIVENLMLKKYIEIFLGITEALGWQDRDEASDVLKKGKNLKNRLDG